MLTDTTIKNAKAKDKPYKLADEKGMFLLVNPNGSKYFRLKYRFTGKEKVLALGVYPDTSLKEARDARDKAREMLKQGIDPSDNRKAVKMARIYSAENSLEVVAREWFAAKMTDKSESHKKRTLAALVNDVFPYIGDKAMQDIRTPEILSALRRVEERGAIETAHRILQTLGQVFRYAVSTGRIESDITPSLKGSLKNVNGGHFGAITDPVNLGALLRAIDSYAGSFVVRTALQVAPLLFVRPGELRSMEWAQIDFEAKEWRYFVTKTKVNHIVPLSSQAIALLEAIKPLTSRGIASACCCEVDDMRALLTAFQQAQRTLKNSRQ